MEINKLGKITEKISDLVAYTSTIIMMLASFYDEVIKAYEIKLQNLVMIPFLILIVFFILKNGLSNYNNYSKFITGNISKTRYTIYSILSIISIILINLAILSFIIFEGHNPHPFIFLLICSIGTIPNVIFIAKSYYPNFFKQNKKYNISLPSKKIKAYFLAMESVEVIVFSMIIGVVGGLLLGYIGGDVVHKKFHFNYLIGVSSFLIIMGISYLVLNKKIKNYEN